MKRLSILYVGYPLGKINKSAFAKKGVGISLLIFFLLLIAKPSLLSHIPFEKWLIIAIIISFIVFLNFYLFSIQFLIIYNNRKTWNFAMDVYFILALFLSIYICILILALPVMHTLIDPSFKISLKLLWNISIYIFSIGVPIYLSYKIYDILLFVFKHQSDLNWGKKTTPIQSLRSTRSIELLGKNSGEKIELSLESFAYIVAKGHYIEINYYDKNNTLAKVVFRNSISEIINCFYDFQEVVQCHRSYVVNLVHVTEIKGNSKKKYFTLKNLNCQISISRNRIKQMKDHMNDLL